MTDEERKISQRAAVKKYRATPEGKAACKRREASPERVAARARYEATPERVAMKLRTGRKRNASPGYKVNRRRRLYGLDGKTFDKLILKQQGACAICKITFCASPYIDHDHTTGQVRGLLCRSCNFVLGFAKDSPEILVVAADYLRRSATTVVLE